MPSAVSIDTKSFADPHPQKRKSEAGPIENLNLR